MSRIRGGPVDGCARTSTIEQVAGWKAQERELPTTAAEDPSHPEVPRCSRVSPWGAGYAQNFRRAKGLGTPTKTSVWPEFPAPLISSDRGRAGGGCGWANIMCRNRPWNSKGARSWLLRAGGAAVPRLTPLTRSAAPISSLQPWATAARQDSKLNPFQASLSRACF